MGWGIYEVEGGRDAGYQVPAICDHPGCEAEIDRGVSYACGGEPRGGEYGCGLYFCSEHLFYKDVGDRHFVQTCERCLKDQEPFDPKPDALMWVGWKLQHESWQEWRDENPEEVAKMQQRWDSEPRSEEFMAEFAELR